ncbi:MAG TPA: XdhC family protein [Patescibacteria group bacterium]|nr:XdhC family protein [Patescibacteria group bacterium]
MGVFDEILTAIRKKQTQDVLTLIAAPAAESWRGNIVSGEQAEWIQGRGLEGLPEALRPALRQELGKTVWQRPTLLTLSVGGDVYQVFWDRAVGRPRAIVLGGGHISQPLVEMLAMLEFAPTVVDDRPEFANPCKFPRAAHIVCQPFQKALLQLDIDVDSVVVIVTRGHRYDLECLRAMLGKEVRYLGMIGSRRRVRGIMAMLKAEGVAAELLDGIHTPIGLDIGAETPAEIAVSIVAEIISTVRNASGQALYRQQEEQHG